MHPEKGCSGILTVKFESSALNAAVLLASSMGYSQIRSGTDEPNIGV